MGANPLSADTWVTFQVDMSVQANLGRFNPLTESVVAKAYEWHGGSRLLSWRLGLTNEPAATNPFLYRGTGLITNDAPGATLSYCFRAETQPDGGFDRIRSAWLPDTEGASLVLPVVYYYDELAAGNVLTNTIALTFQVDMTAQVDLGGFNPGSDRVEVGARCDPEGVTYGYPLTNNPHAPNPNLYTSTVVRTNFTPGGIVSYRFSYHDSAWRRFVEQPQSTSGEDRTATLPATPEPSLVLPVVYFDDLPAGVALVTNDVTFQVDLSAQMHWIADWFPPLPVSVRCTVYGGDVQLTNFNGAINTNIYRGTLRIISLPEARFEYQFHHRGDFPRPTWSRWEQFTERSSSLLTTNGPIVLPVVFFDDLQSSDVLPRSTVVRLSVDMAGAVTTDGHPFHPTLDRVFVNGDFIHWYPEGGVGGSVIRGWGPWDPIAWAPDFLKRYHLTNVPGTQVYTGAVSIDPSERLALTYRYSINGQDNEPPGGQNHVRYVRNAGEYTLPLDKFGAPEQEPSFGNLRAVLATPGNVGLSWLGRLGVRLQSCSSATGPWQDHPESDGLSATNWLVSDGSRFFRLFKP